MESVCGIPFFLGTDSSSDILEQTDTMHMIFNYGTNYQTPQMFYHRHQPKMLVVCLDCTADKKGKCMQTSDQIISHSNLCIFTSSIVKVMLK